MSERSRKIKHESLMHIMLLLCMSLILCLPGCALADAGRKAGENTEWISDLSNTNEAEEETTLSLEEALAQIPAWSGMPYTEVNGNQPYFDTSDLTTTSYETYSVLDTLGRCGVAMACIGLDIMPTEERDSISSVTPTGWQSVTYDLIEDGYLYNRCHLIAYMLTAENANEENLITGTRYLNVEGMLPFEILVADYIDETENHVLYRVTPLFDGDNLVVSGILMEAESVEDEGEGVLFCVYCYNVQPGIVIDYATGDSQVDETYSETEINSGETANQTKDTDQTENSEDTNQKETADQTKDPEDTDQTETAEDAEKEETSEKEETDTAVDTDSDTTGTTYILNTNSMKFHYPSCESVSKMSEKNKQEYIGDREDLISQGYEPCKNCNP